MRAKNLLVAALGLLVVMACGKDQPKGTLPTDTPTAIAYYKQFNFDRGYSVPAVSGGAQYAQSAQLRLEDGSIHGKFNLFMFEDNTFAFEYTEIAALSEAPVKGKVNGVVVTGKYYVEDTKLILKNDDGKAFAEGEAKIAPNGVASIYTKFKRSLRDFKADLKMEKPSDQLYFSYNRTNRVLPSGDLKSALSAEMAGRATSGRTDEEFKN